MPAATSQQILLTDYAWPNLAVEERLVAAAGHQLIVAPDGHEETLVGLAQNVSAIVTCWATVSAAVIDAAPACRVVSRLGIGLDNIDVAHCTQKGIPVTNVPAYCVDEVAEHALALILALRRNIAYFHLQTKQGQYSLTAAGTMHRLRGQTLGIAGFGRIGQALATRALGMGMDVITWTQPEYDGDLPVRQVTFPALLQQSDVLSIHLPLTPQTHRLFDAQALASMKPTAILVNTARGPLIDSSALAAALAAGTLAGAGLDVQDPEPPDLADPLYRHDRVIVTPHAAFTSEESLTVLRETAFRQALDVLAGKPPENLVNPEAISSGR